MTSSRIMLAVGLLTVAGFEVHSAEEPPKSAAPYGLTERVPWTTSNFRGRPEPPPPFRAVRQYARLRFQQTTLIAVPPASEQIFVGQRDGKIFALPADRNATEAPLFLDCAQLVSRLSVDPNRPIVFDSLYGLTFDPDFATNRFCYVCYVVRYRDRALGQLADGTRVVRLSVDDIAGSPRCNVDSEQLIISWLEGGHNGGCLKFGPDGCLYVSTGDGGNAFPPDGLKSGQDMTTLLAKILRIDVRRGDKGKLYSIPADNPFVQLAGARGETWSYGLRNPWKMSFDRATGSLWVGDVGWELWELVYNVDRGDNFGWSIVEGSQPVHTEGKRGPTPIVPPTMEIPHTEGASITGGFVYRGRQFPELVGSYVFGDWETRRVWSAKVVDEKLAERVELIDPTIRIVDFAETRDGELLLLDHDDGGVFSLTRNEAVTEPNRFPRKLSDTGLFTSTAEHRLAPGVIPFSINAEQWSDHATAYRFLAVPGSGSIHIRPKPTLVPGSQFSRATDYPLDTVVVKTLSLEMKAGDPTSRRQIETQALHYDGREWQGYTFEWNDQQTDAVLVDRGGKNKTFTVQDADEPEGRRTQTWRFSARAECIRCHNPWSEYTLAFNVAQLNRTHDYGGVHDNQLHMLRHIGVLVDDPDLDLPPDLRGPPREPDAMPRLARPFDESADLSARARSYLHVNCGHCHRFNGGGSSYIYLQHDLPLPEVRAIGVRPTQGTFGIHDAQLLAPGDPYRSVLYFRLAKTGPGHMPHLGAKIVDERALRLVHDWIRQLPVRVEDAAKVDKLIALEETTDAAKAERERRIAEWQSARRVAQRAGREEPNEEELATARQLLTVHTSSAATKRTEDRRRIIGELLASPSSAMLLVEAVRRERLPTKLRDDVLEAALAAATDPAVRDLFEAFVPEERRTQRLGDVINAAELLKLAGDAERGRKLFQESTVVQCRNCHRIAGKGIELGPDLDSIGKKLDRAKLLESILQPSQQIDPKYAVWMVETKSGLVYSGLKVRQNDKELVIRDAQNKEHRVAADDVDGVYPQAKSLMPEMQLREFTAAQVADLLEYLSTLKAEPPPK